MSITIVIPGLFWLDKDNAEYLYKNMNILNLNSLLKHSLISYLDYGYTDICYFKDNLASTLTYARNLAKELNVNKLFSNYLIAEPTSMKFVNNILQISKPEMLNLTQLDSISIINELNEYFNNEIKIFFYNEVTWLLGHNLNFGEQNSYSAIDVVGEDIQNYLPDRNSNLLFNKLITDIQIFLFNSPYNLIRQKNKELTINNLWLWDKNVANKSDFLDKKFYKISLDSIKNISKEFFEKNNYLLIDDLYIDAKQRNMEGYIDKLEVLENFLFTKLNFCLREKIITEINILVPQINNTVKIYIKKHNFKLFRKELNLINIIKGLYGK